MTEIFRRLQDMDDRIVYLAVAVALLIPLVKPLNLPLTPSKMSRDAYDYVDKMPSGARVFIVSEMGPSDQAEMLPQLTVLYRHALKRGLRVVYCPTDPTAAPYMTDLIERYPAEYGRDVVILPFKAGGESLVVQIGQNFRGIYDKDQSGKSLDAMPIMQGVKSIGDMNLVVSIGSADLFRYVVRHVQAAHKVPTIVGCGAVITSFVTPFYSSGQLVGILSGLGGAADYEFLSALPGKAVAGMDAQSLGHLVLMLVILLGNISLFVLKKDVGERGGIK